MRLHLIDGSGYIYRAFYTLPPMQRSDGLHCGAIHGYSSMLWRLLRSYGRDLEPPTHVAIVLDPGGKTARHAIYGDYKANRKAMDDTLAPQLPYIRDATRAFNVASCELPGYEADDLIATYARHAAEAGWDVTVVSIDKDLMQLVGGPVKLFDPVKNIMIGPMQVHEKFGVPAERVVDVLSLMGDASDNIPGVPTIGSVTATKLIAQFGDLDTLLENIEQLPEKTRQAFEWPARYVKNASGKGGRWVPDPEAEGDSGVVKAIMSRKLVTLNDDVPVIDPIHAFECRPIDPGQLIEFLQEMEFNALADEWSQALTGVFA